MEPRSWPPLADGWGIRTVLASSNLSPHCPLMRKAALPPPVLRADEGTLRFRSRMLYLISGLSSQASPKRPLPGPRSCFFLEKPAASSGPQITTGYVGAGTSPQTGFAWLTKHWLRRYVFKNLHHLPTLKNQKLSHKKFPVFQLFLKT